MNTVEVRQVIATRAGEIADESDSEGEEADEIQGMPFWLCVVVQQSTKAEKQGLVKQTNVQTNERCIVVRWLEEEEGVSGGYVLSNKEDCIPSHRAGGLITVKTLGKIPSLGVKNKDTRYKLHATNYKKIMATAKRK